MAKKTRESRETRVDAQDMLEMLAEALALALEPTNELLAALVSCMTCEDCDGTGRIVVRDDEQRAQSERCRCRDDAASVLVDDGEDDNEDDDEDEES